MFSIKIYNFILPKYPEYGPIPLFNVCAGEDIAGKTMQHWRSGGKREELTYLDVEEALTLTAFNKLGWSMK